jgi:hypothetical protein
MSERSTTSQHGCILYKDKARGWSWMVEPAVEILLRCEDLAHVQLASFRYIPAIDDFEANLSYRGHQFALWMDWDGDIALLAKPDVPEELFSELCVLLRSHKVKWYQRWRRLRRFQSIYRRPAKATWYEKPDA